MKKLSGAHAFASVACASCGAEWRPREEIGGFRLIEPLSRSGLGMIFRAIEPESGATVAVKILRPPFGFTTDDLARFAKDVEILAGLEHPHWLPVFGGGIEGDLAWLAMEWLPSGSLADLLAVRGRLGESEALHFAAQIASALSAARAAGLQHRDLNITNCLLADAQTVKVGGFAEALFYQRAGEEVGTIWGRLSCAPPERIFGEPEDARSEIYALGAILFQVLAGTLPYEGETVPELFLERLEGPPLRLGEFVRAIQKSTADVVERMLAVEREQRFETWDEVADHIANALESVSRSHSPAPARPRAVARAAAKAPVHSSASGAWFTLLMLIGIAGFGGWFWWNHRDASRSAAAVPPAPIVAAPEPTPPPVAIIPKEPATPKAARPRRDWTGWTTTVLESPNKPRRTVQGEARRIPSSDALRLTGNGTGIAGGHDECVFHSRSLDGDWTLTARIGANKGFAALCARAAMESDQPCVAVTVATDGSVTTAVRRSPGAKAEIQKRAGPIRPEWLRVSRRGTKLTAFFAVKNNEWTEAAALDLSALPASVPAGFMVWSAGNEKAAATFDDIELSFEK